MDKKTKWNEIRFLLERLYTANEIPLQVYNQKRELIMQLGLDEPVLPPSFQGEDINEQIFHPVLEIEDEIFIYGIFSDGDGYEYVYGPIALEIPNLSKMYNYRRCHNIADRSFSVAPNTLMGIANVVSLAYGICTGKMLEEREIIAKNASNLAEIAVGDKDVNQYLFEKSEEGTGHLSYQYEQRYLAAIESGDIDFFKGTLIEEPRALEKVGLLARDSKKQVEYMCVSSTVLVSRAAISGGLNPSVAYGLSELYMQKIEKARDIKEILNLHQKMQVDFVTKVREQKEKIRHEGYIEACKDYISQRVHYPIRVEEIAKMLGMNHSYLTRRFKEKEGMTIIQYSINAKLQAAANMLKYSDASISQVADYFCFASQSRFGSQFREKYGVTPAVYRKENQVIDFAKNDKKV